MPICYHCGSEVSESFHCTKCGQSYCSLHKDPIDHECNIVIESLNFRSQQTPQITPSYTAQTQSIPQSVSQSTMQEGVVRGTSDGSYTCYRQEQAVPEDACSRLCRFRFFLSTTNATGKTIANPIITYNMVFQTWRFDAVFVARLKFGDSTSTI